MPEHTKLPWRVFTNPSGTKLVGVGGQDGEGILDAGFGVWAWNDPEGIANANFVVKACNAFPDLVKALESIVVAERQFRDAMGDHWEGDPLSDAIDAGSRILSRVKSPGAPS
jgi:hypothetical protein